MGMGKVMCWLSFEILAWGLLFIYKSKHGDRVDRVITKEGAGKLP